MKTKSETMKIKKGEEPKMEIIVLEDGKETMRINPDGFVGCGLLDVADEKLRRGEVKAQSICFGRQIDMLFALHILIEELAKTGDVVPLMLTIQKVLQEIAMEKMGDIKMEEQLNKKGKTLN